MKAKLLKILRWIRDGFVILIVLVGALVCLSFLSELEDKFMTPEEKAAYTLGYDDALEGNERAVPVEETEDGE